MQTDDNFTLLGLTVRLRHRTRDSRVYDVGKCSRVLDFDDGTSFDTRRQDGVFEVFGRMQVHYPCDGHVKAVISVDLPKEHCGDAAKCARAVAEILRCLRIPKDETYAISLREPAPSVGVENHVNRQGWTDASD
jgi:hypothetical protein